MFSAITNVSHWEGDLRENWNIVSDQTKCISERPFFIFLYLLWYMEGVGPFRGLSTVPVQSAAQMVEYK